MIYLDHAAATPVSRKALAAMQPYFSDDFFNPSAPYLPAKHVREAYEAAKDDLAHVIGAKGVDLVITGGATESINLAFTAAHGKILTLATEHSAVLEAAKSHSYELIKVDQNGLIDLRDFQEKLTPEVDFVSISLANNELGTIQPLVEISEIIRRVRQSRLQQGNSTPLYLHSDASQALNLLDLNVSRLGVDLLTINAAKCGGPKGVGALYVGHGIKLSPINVGGGQERGLRSGTENVPSVIGFAVAASEAKLHLSASRKKYQQMSQILRAELSQIGLDSSSNFTKRTSKNASPDRAKHTKKAAPLEPATSKTPAQKLPSAPSTSIVAHNGANVKHNPHSSLPQPIFLGSPKHQLANFVPVCFSGIDAERLIYKLEQREVYVSTGAACAANKGSKSHVLAAIGLTDEQIAGSLRISLGSTNDLDQIRRAATIIREEVEREYGRIGKSRHYLHKETTRSATSEEEAASTRDGGLEERRVSWEGDDDIRKRKACQ